MRAICGIRAKRAYREKRQREKGRKDWRREAQRSGLSGVGAPPEPELGARPPGYTGLNALYRRPNLTRGLEPGILLKAPLRGA